MKNVKTMKKVFTAQKKLNSFSCFKNSIMVKPSSLLYKNNKATFSQMNEFNYLHSIRGRDKVKIYSDNKNNEFAEKLENLRGVTNFNKSALAPLVKEFLDYMEKNEEDFYCLYQMLSLLTFQRFYDNRFTAYLINSIPKILSHKDSFFIYPSICNFIHNRSLHLFRLPLDANTIKVFETTLYEKGTLLNLKELFQVSMFYRQYYDLLSNNFVNYLERCMMHSMENTLYKSHSVFKNALNSLVSYYSPFCSVSFFEKLVNAIYQQIDDRSYNNNELYEILFNLTNKRKYFLKLIRTNKDLTKFYLPDKVVIINNFFNEMSKFIFEKLKSEVQLTSQAVENLIPVALEFHDILFNEIEDISFTDKLIQKLERGNIPFNLSTVCNILKKVCDFAKNHYLIKSFIRVLEVPLFSQLKNLQSPKEMSILSVKSVRRNLSNRNSFILTKFIELNLFERLIHSYLEKQRLDMNYLYIIRNIYQDTIDVNSIFVLLFLNDVLKQIDVNEENNQVEEKEEKEEKEEQSLESEIDLDKLDKQ